MGNKGSVMKTFEEKEKKSRESYKKVSISSFNSLYDKWTVLVPCLKLNLFLTLSPLFLYVLDHRASLEEDLFILLLGGSLGVVIGGKDPIALGDGVNIVAVDEGTKEFFNLIPFGVACGLDDGSAVAVAEGAAAADGSAVQLGVAERLGAIILDGGGGAGGGVIAAVVATSDQIALFANL